MGAWAPAVLAAAILIAVLLATQFGTRGRMRRAAAASPFVYRPARWGSVRMRRRASRPTASALDIQPADVSSVVREITEGIRRLGQRLPDGSCQYPTDIVVFAHAVDAMILQRCRPLIEGDIAAALDATGLADRPVLLRDIVVDDAIVLGRPLAQRWADPLRHAAAHRDGWVPNTPPDLHRVPPPPSFPCLESLTDDVGQLRLAARGGTLGRDPESCSMVVEGSTVSRRHARLIPIRDGFEIRDLGSANGLCVNGERVGQAVIRNGDIVGLGRAVRLRLNMSGPPPCAVRPTPTLDAESTEIV